MTKKYIACTAKIFALFKSKQDLSIIMIIIITICYYELEKKIAETPKEEKSMCVLCAEST